MLKKCKLLIKKNKNKNNYIYKYINKFIKKNNKKKEFLLISRIYYNKI